MRSRALRYSAPAFAESVNPGQGSAPLHYCNLTGFLIKTHSSGLEFF